MKRLFIFDLDNTFYKYNSSHKYGLESVYDNQKIFNTYESFLLAYEDIKLSVHRDIPESPSKHSKLIYFKNLFYKDLSSSEIIMLENTYWDSFIKNVELQKTAIDLLKAKKNRENVYVLFTNQNLSTQLRKINAWNLNFFDEIITSEEAGYEKPSLKFFNFVSPVIERYHDKGYDLFALGDDFNNDLSFWLENYFAKGYLIDNDSSHLVEMKGFKKGNLNNSVGEIFEIS